MAVGGTISANRAFLMAVGMAAATVLAGPIRLSDSCAIAVELYVRAAANDPKRTRRPPIVAAAFGGKADTVEISRRGS